MSFSKLFRPYVLSVLLGAVLTLGPTPGGALPYADTCRFFSNAAFEDRQTFGVTTFRMELAQDCIDALVYMQLDQPGVSDRAEAYLAQLEAYRQVIVGMLVARARARPSQAEVSPGHQLWRPAVYPVSRTGAYLIARQMGLVDIHRDWTTWRRSAALPLFRLEEVQAN